MNGIVLSSRNYFKADLQPPGSAEPILPAQINNMCTKWSKPYQL